jgi:hypothetical protein
MRHLCPYLILTLGFVSTVGCYEPWEDDERSLAVTACKIDRFGSCHFDIDVTAPKDSVARVYIGPDVGDGKIASAITAAMKRNKSQAGVFGCVDVYVGLRGKASLQIMTPTLSKGQKYIAVVTDATKRITTEGAKEDGYYYATKILGEVKEFGELRPPSEVLPRQ